MEETLLREPTEETDKLIMEFMQFANPHSFEMEGLAKIGDGITFRGVVIRGVALLCERLSLTGYVAPGTDERRAARSIMEVGENDATPHLDELMTQLYGQNGLPVAGERYIHATHRNTGRFGYQESVREFVDVLLFKRKLQALADVARPD